MLINEVYPADASSRLCKLIFIGTKYSEDEMCFVEVKTVLIRAKLVQPGVNKCARIGQLFNYSQIKGKCKQATEYILKISLNMLRIF